MKIFTVGNLVFYPFENNDWSKTKYVKGSISGDLFLNNIYSEQEIRDEYTDVKECKNLHEVVKLWGNR